MTIDRIIFQTTWIAVRESPRGFSILRDRSRFLKSGAIVSNHGMKFLFDPHGELFPHLYGALNLDAVTQAIGFEPNADGCFTLPLALQD